MYELTGEGERLAKELVLDYKKRDPDTIRKLEYAKFL